jgi:hypothetical protein
LAVGIAALTPALQRSDNVGRADRLPIMELKPVPQSENVGELVVAYRPVLNHLRLRPELAVHREQRVINHVAEVAGDVDPRPVWIEDRKIGMRNEPQGRAGALLGHHVRSRE